MEAAGNELNLGIPDSMQCCEGSHEVHSPKPPLMSYSSFLTIYCFPSPITPSNGNLTIQTLRKEGGEERGSKPKNRTAQYTYYQIEKVQVLCGEMD